MINAVVVVVASGLLAGLLIAEKKGDTGLILTFKTPLSILFVTVALLQPPLIPVYYRFVLAGLVCGLIGDVCLALKGSTSFKAGLVVFLLGHVLYVVAFAGLTRPSDWATPAHLVIAAFSLGVFWYLRPHLGAMKVPVGVYVIVISFMIAAAWVVLQNPELNRDGVRTLFAGAVCFYISDLFVARDRFVKTQFANRLMGLPLYYLGQFLIAFSVGMVR